MENTCYAGNYSVRCKSGPLASMEGCKFISFSLAEDFYYPFLFLCFTYVRCLDLFFFCNGKKWYKKS